MVCGRQADELIHWGILSIPPPTLRSEHCELPGVTPITEHHGTHTGFLWTVDFRKHSHAEHICLDRCVGTQIFIGIFNFDIRTLHLIQLFTTLDVLQVGVYIYV